MQKHSLQFAIFKRIAVCMQLISCSNRLGIHSNGSSYLLKKKWSAIQTARAVHAKKKLSSVWVARAICSKKIVSCLSGSSYPCKTKLFSVGELRLSVWKKLSAVRTAWAIRSKKIGNRSKARSSYLFKEKFSPVSIPEQFPRQPLVSNDLLFSR